LQSQCRECARVFTLTACHAEKGKGNRRLTRIGEDSVEYEQGVIVHGEVQIDEISQNFIRRITCRGRSLLETG
jgi:hypothetical protein